MSKHVLIACLALTVPACLRKYDAFEVAPAKTVDMPPTAGVVAADAASDPSEPNVETAEDETTTDTAVDATSPGATLTADAVDTGVAVDAGVAVDTGVTGVAPAPGGSRTPDSEFDEAGTPIGSSDTSGDDDDDDDDAQESSATDAAILDAAILDAGASFDPDSTGIDSDDDTPAVACGDCDALRSVCNVECSRTAEQCLLSCEGNPGKCRRDCGDQEQSCNLGCLQACDSCYLEEGCLVACAE